MPPKDGKMIMLISNSLTSLLFKHQFPLGLIHVCFGAKTGNAVSNLHAPPVFSGNPNLQRHKLEVKDKINHNNKNTPASSNRMSFCT